MLIELAGIDGSGKSTFAERIMRLFNSAGVPCYQRSFRSTYKRIAADISARHGHRHWSGLFEPNEIEVAQAFEMVHTVYQQVLPLDLDAQVIVMDTYVSSWLATAALWRSDALERLREVYALLPAPDVSILLEVPVEEAARRISRRPKGDHIFKTGSDSVLARYAEAFEQTRALVPYAQNTVPAVGALEETWEAVRTAVFAAAEASGRHPAALGRPQR
ncbi:hypothetical protein [Streptomyces odontomachi]|uniref:hypothetical protein n=1 Tax=Streptomyces odontomachi TaxID=2944940 RepID=UPI00210E0CD3|nr:hypothetical protein [Streptomyces sp. ODS25]